MPRRSRVSPDASSPPPPPNSPSAASPAPASTASPAAPASTRRCSITTSAASSGSTARCCAASSPLAGRAPARDRRRHHAPPADKIDAAIAVIRRAGPRAPRSSRPIMLREVAEGGAHLDPRNTDRRSPACRARSRPSSRKASPPASSATRAIRSLPTSRWSRRSSSFWPARRSAAELARHAPADMPRADAPTRSFAHVQETVAPRVRARRRAAEDDTMRRSLPEPPAARIEFLALARGAVVCGALRSRRPIAFACPARSRRPTCGSRRRWADVLLELRVRKAIASRPAISIATLDTADAELTLARAQRRARSGRRAAAAAAGGRPSRRHSPGRSAGRRRAGRRRGRTRRSSPRHKPTSIASNRSSPRTPAPASSATMR